MQPLFDDLYRFEDTCNVYIIRSKDSAVLIDFGSGDVLDHLPEIGISHVSAVLMTHHHRDQGQGLARAVAADIPIWVPHTEQDLFQHVNAHWHAREIFNNYNMRQDRFSLLESVPVAGTLKDYEKRSFLDKTFTVIPTPGHTPGSISLWLEVADKKIAFTGDLIYAPGKVWSMAATQWSYNGAEGVAASIASLLDIKERQPDWLLPSHGALIDSPIPAIDLLVERLWQLLQLRGQNPRLFELREQPYEAITPHLLRHRASVANSYVVLSDSGKALIIDFGYDFVTGLPPSGSDRASRRPWLYTIPALKRQFGIEKIDVILPTHFHDDHVAGINLLRDVEGTQLWAADLFADILEHPARYDLPCLWYDPIPVDRRLPLQTPIQWEEYSFTLYPLPGHTLYAVAISFEVDGYRVLATGDQYQGDTGLELNYVYPNRFDSSDYAKSAALYRQLQPDLILTGHWQPFRVPADYYDKLEKLGTALERLHRELLPESPGMGTEGFLARIAPYQAWIQGGESITLDIEVRNPYDREAQARVQMMVPQRWEITDISTQQYSIDTALIQMQPLSTCTVAFTIKAPADFSGRRVRLAADVTIDHRRFGQQAEALISTR